MMSTSSVCAVQNQFDYIPRLAQTGMSKQFVVLTCKTCGKQVPGFGSQATWNMFLHRAMHERHGTKRKRERKDSPRVPSPGSNRRRRSRP